MNNMENFPEMDDAELRESFENNKPEAGKPSVERAIKNFDFNELDDILSDLGKSVGVYDKKLRAIRDIVIKSEPLASAVYHVEDKTISIEDFYDPKLLKQGERDYFNHTIIHEEIHAISGQSYSNDDEGETSRVGFHKTVIKNYRIKENIFKYWNEGVTEKLAREVNKKYFLIKRLGTQKDADKLDGVIAEDGAYQKEVELVNAFIERVAKSVGVSEELVWKSIIQAMINGEKWQEEDFSKIAKGILPPNFMDDVKNILWVGHLTRELKSDKSDNFIKTSKIGRFLRRELKDKPPGT